MFHVMANFIFILIIWYILDDCLTLVFPYPAHHVSTFCPPNKISQWERRLCNGHVTSESRVMSTYFLTFKQLSSVTWPLCNLLSDWLISFGGQKLYRLPTRNVPGKFCLGRAGKLPTIFLWPTIFTSLFSSKFIRQYLLERQCPISNLQWNRLLNEWITRWNLVKRPNARLSPCCVTNFLGVS